MLCTGTITVGERATQQDAERRSVYGESGRAVGTRTAGNGRHEARLRVAVQEADGRSSQIPIALSLDEDPVFLQDGDVVTMIGRRGKDGVMKAPAIANHVGQFVMMPRRLRSESVILVIILALAVLLLVAPHLASSREVRSLAPFGPFFLAAAAASGFVLQRDARRGAALRAGMADVMAGWATRIYDDPSGVVDGVFVYTRGYQQPSEWVSFRLAMAARDGAVQDWLVAAAPLSKIATELRMGDVVRLRGSYATGRIHRPRRIEIVSIAAGQG